MAKVIICIDTNGNSSIGTNLEDAWSQYQRDVEQDTIENICFYEAEEIQVEVKLQKVPVKSK